MSTNVTQKFAAPRGRYGEVVSSLINRTDSSDDIREAKLRELDKLAVTIQTIYKSRTHCPRCRGRVDLLMKIDPHKHDCRHERRYWRIVADPFENGTFVVTSVFDPHVWAVWVDGVGITELIPEALVPALWKDAAHMDPFYDPQDPQYRRSAFQRPRPDDPNIVSYQHVIEGRRMLGLEV